MEHQARMKRIFNGMRARCKTHLLYAGKGIKVEWETFEDFFRDMSPSYLAHAKKHGERNTTIDRIDSDDHYSKKNCRWATYAVQARNMGGIPLNAEYDKSKLCTLCGLGFRERIDPRKEMHDECAYDLKKARIQAKFHAWKGDRRALYFANLVRFYELTREGVEI